MEIVNYIKRVKQNALSYPDKVVIVENNATRETTNAELWALTEKIAAQIKSTGSVGKIIPIVLPDSMEYFAAEIAIWMTGNCAVNLGSSFPEDRVNYIMQVCEAEFMIDSAFIDKAKQLTEGCSDIYERQSCQPCVMFFTSGSTGNPKGVQHSDRGFIAKEMYGTVKMGYDKFSSFASIAPNYFVAIVSVLVRICLNVTVHILTKDIKTDPAKLMKYMEVNNIETAFISPSILQVISNSLSKLKIIFTGSERLVGCYSENYTLINCYGQTETAGTLMIKLIDKGYDNSPVGQPVPGIEVCLLDEQGNEVPDGELGELCIKSGFPTPQYFKDPVRTQELTQGGVQHTGDLMKRLPNGDYLYVQRKDWMVKINGQRVEPGEIETVMKQMSGIKDAVVKGFTTEDLSRQYLVCYYILNPDSDLDSTKIEAELKKTLPAYMVPAYMVQMDSFPLNANFKVDRKNLKSPAATATNQSEYVAPTNEVEKALCDAFAKVLKLERVGIDDDFFLLGGDSIRAMQLQQHLQMKNITTMVNSGRTPRKIAELYASLEKVVSVGVGEHGMYPLTDIQKAYLEVCVPLEGMPVLNILNLVQLNDEVNLNRLAESIGKVLDIHPAMFIRYHRAADGSIVQNIQKEPVCIEIEHLTDEELDALKPKLAKAFRYFEERLFQFRLFKTPSAQYLFYDIHHSIFDGGSMSILFADIENVYLGKDIDMEKDSYLNVALEEHAMHGTDYYESAREGFMTMFKDYPHTLYVENAGSNYMEHEKRILGVKASEATTFCAENNITMNTLTTTAFVMLLGTETGSRDVVFGSQFSGRTDASVSNMVGLFAKPIFMRFTWNKDSNTTDFLKTVSQTINQSIANSIYSISEIRKNKLVSSQLQFVYQDQISSEPIIGGFPTKTIDFRRNQTPSTMVVNVFRNIVADELVILIAYREDIFSKERIDCMLKTYDENLRKLTRK